MSRVVSAATDILCESCGYTLNGLPDHSNCPECGTPIVESTSPDRRTLTGFEQRTGASSFLATTIAVLLHPHRFYRGIVTRQSHPAAAWFARRHRVIASALFATAALGHALWAQSQMLRPIQIPAIYARQSWTPLVVWIAFALLIYALLAGVTRLAAFLSSKEGAFWGMRLPQAAVMRCLQYHSACYLPISVLAVAIVWGYRAMLANGIGWTAGPYYLFTLSAGVLVSAAYLFRMYWIAMTNIRYANR